MGNEIIRSKAPLRISFAGGGTDVSPYTEERGGAVLNATINRYAYTTVTPLPDRNIELVSVDYDVALKYDLDQEIALDGQLDVIKAVVNEFRSRHNLDSGLRVMVHCDAPPGSGLGSSSAVAVSVITALAEYLRVPMTAYEIAHMAFYVEREVVKIPGGRQDQYAAAFGGFNLMEFTKHGAVVNPLRIPKHIVNELQYSIVLAYAGRSRFSGTIIEKQVENYRSRARTTAEALDNIKELAYKMKDALVLGDLRRFAELLHEEWEFKKRMAEGISNEQIDTIYSEARKAGAIGGKISGAGGGGFMFFYVEIESKNSVIRRLQDLGLQILPFGFEEEGATAWRTRC